MTWPVFWPPLFEKLVFNQGAKALNQTYASSERQKDEFRFNRGVEALLGHQIYVVEFF